MILIEAQNNAKLYQKILTIRHVTFRRPMNRCSLKDFKENRRARTFSSNYLKNKSNSTRAKTHADDFQSDVTNASNFFVFVLHQIDQIGRSVGSLDDDVSSRPMETKLIENVANLQNDFIVFLSSWNQRKTFAFLFRVKEDQIVSITRMSLWMRTRFTDNKSLSIKSKQTSKIVTQLRQCRFASNGRLSAMNSDESRKRLNNLECISTFMKQRILCFCVQSEKRRIDDREITNELRLLKTSSFLTVGFGLFVSS